MSGLWTQSLPDNDKWKLYSFSVRSFLSWQSLPFRVILAPSINLKLWHHILKSSEHHPLVMSLWNPRWVRGDLSNLDSTQKSTNSLLVTTHSDIKILSAQPLRKKMRSWSRFKESWDKVCFITTGLASLAVYNIIRFLRSRLWTSRVWL